MENPTIPQETLLTEQEHISEECRQSLLEYVKESSDSAVGEEVRLPTPEEAKAAEELLSLELPRNDSAPNRHYSFSDSNYKFDVAIREKVMEQYGLKDCEIRRHDIAITQGNGVLPVKVINVVKVSMDEDRNIKYINIPEAILFMGKISYEGQQHKYVELTEDELSYVNKFIEKNMATE